MNVECVHDAWYRTDRLWLAILVAFMVAIGAAQAYRAGERAGRDHEFYAGYEQGCLTADRQNTTSNDEVLAQCMESIPDTEVRK